MPSLLQCGIGGGRCFAHTVPVTAGDGKGGAVGEQEGGAAGEQEGRAAGKQEGGRGAGDRDSGVAGE